MTDLIDDRIGWTDEEIEEFTHWADETGRSARPARTAPEEDILEDEIAWDLWEVI